MKDYTFDMTLKASVTVEAESEEEAERIIRGILDDAATFTAWERQEFAFDENADSVTGECSIHGQIDLAQVDGKDVD